MHYITAEVTMQYDQKWNNAIAKLQRQLQCVDIKQRVGEAALLFFFFF